MAEFFFGSWPNGMGPSMIQLALVLAGALVGIRAIDDVKAWIAARTQAGERSPSR